MANLQRIDRQLDTPSPGTSEGTTFHTLPDALVSDQIRRLAVCAGVGAGLWAYGLAMDTIVRPLTTGAAIPASIVVVEILAIAVSLVMFVYVRYAPHAHGWKTDAGLLYVVLNAGAVAQLNAWTNMAAVSGGRGLSWNTVVVLIAAMILPATPRRMLAASMAAAAMDPLALWAAHLRGAPVPSVAATLVMYMPNFACAVVATLPAHVLHGIGQTLRRAQDMGSYRLVELLGRGGMGEVWRAQHRLLARGAAIKLVRPELLGAGTDGEARSMLRRFEQEAQATAALTSPHTIAVFDFGITADQTFFYVMELLSGRDLQSLVREFGPLPAARVVFLLRQACHSLAEAHARGLVHRDITPSNIYVCRMGLEYDFVKVLDFGLVTFNGRRALEPRTPSAARTTTGTPAFMAPEIILGGEVDQRADVYAIGCVAYYLLTGQPVFDAADPNEMFMLHLEATPVPPSQRSEMPIPPDIDALVLACLEKAPHRRPADAAAVLERLRRWSSSDQWDQQSARTWWERHLVELTAPPLVSSALAAEPSLVAG
jgi:eukaryotic-like serine/threonine-protein kinase